MGEGSRRNKRKFGSKERRGGQVQARSGNEGAESRCRSACKGKGFAEPTEINSIISNSSTERRTPERTCGSNSKQRSEGKAGEGSSSGSQEGKGREGKEGSTSGDSRRGSPQGSSGTCTDFPSKGHEVAAGSR